MRRNWQSESLCYGKLDTRREYKTFLKRDMKTLRKLQIVATTIGLIYGFWLGANIDASGRDIRSAWVIIVLSLIIAVSLSAGKRIKFDDNNL